MRDELFRRNHVCPWWLAYTFDNPLRRLLHDPDALLSSYVQEGMTVADLGCGMGYFSLAMAKMVGRTGKVISVDIQQKMLDTLAKRARKSGLEDHMRFLLADKDDIGIHEPLDFALAFWMVHETGDILRFLKQVASALKNQGRLLIAEPRMHVTGSRFEEILAHAREAGFRIIGTPRIRISRSALLCK